MKGSKLVLPALMVLAMVVALAAPALGQDTGAPKAVIEKGVAKANAGGAKAVAGCPEVPPEAKAGDVVAKAECKPPPPPPPPPPPKAPPPPPKAPPAPPPKAAPAPAPAPPPPAPAPAPAPAPPPPAPAPAPPPPPPPPPKVLPPTGGAGIASLLGLGAGTLLVGGGLLARRIIK
jgi:hypothetical protein